MALANYRANYQPPASAVKMAEDLALLPSWIAQEGDVVCDFHSPVPDVEKYEVKPWGWDLLAGDPRGPAAPSHFLGILLLSWRSAWVRGLAVVSPGQVLTSLPS